MFYTFYQNNSWGHDHEHMPKFLIVQAGDHRQANYIAEREGVYFDDKYVHDCPCCGMRWTRAEQCTGTTHPRIYEWEVLDMEGVLPESAGFWAGYSYKVIRSDM